METKSKVNKSSSKSVKYLPYEEPVVAHIIPSSLGGTMERMVDDRMDVRVHATHSNNKFQ